MKFTFSLGKAKVFASVGVAFPRVEYARGFTNRCEDGRYVLFIDYDGVPLDWIEDELKYVAGLFHISKIHLFKTGNGFHAIATEKLSLNEYLAFLRETSVDPAYYYVPLRVKRLWTLRCSAKDGKRPEYVKTITCCKSVREHSLAHCKALKALYNIAIPIHNDGKQKLISGHYYDKLV